MGPAGSPTAVARVAFACLAVAAGVTACLGDVRLVDDAREEPMQIQTPTGAVHGTLLVPEGQGPHPVAVIVAGSGPTDRDGNSPMLPGRNDSLKQLAEGLGDRGVATLRYDKRGIAASSAAGPREQDLRFDTYIDDAGSWVKQLRDDSRFSTVSIVGHSEGSLIGMCAARSAEADAFVSVAGIAQSAPHVLREQLRGQLTSSLWGESERILEALEAGRTAGDVPQELFALYRPSVQPYLISWFRYEPVKEIARLSVPVMIVQGTRDIQVSVEQARALQGAKPGAEMLVIEGMNHVLKMLDDDDPGRQQASYADPSLTVSAELLDGVAAFVRSVSV